MLDQMLEDDIGVRTRELCYVHLGAAFSIVSPGIMRNVARPKPPKKEMLFWRSHEAHAFLHHVRTDPFEPLYRFALKTGARRGEIFGLQWQDIDFANGQFRIARTLDDLTLETHEPKPKRPNESSS